MVASRTPRLLLGIDLLALLMVSVATLMIFFYAPTEAVMGPVQKVFYFHVAAGWLGMLGILCSTGRRGNVSDYPAPRLGSGGAGRC
jgi:ABC-type transport system involved in cytochrome c biogenesis permease subunit